MLSFKSSFNHGAASTVARLQHPSCPYRNRPNTAVLDAITQGPGAPRTPVGSRPGLWAIAQALAAYGEDPAGWAWKLTR